MKRVAISFVIVLVAGAVGFVSWIQFGALPSIAADEALALIDARVAAEFPHARESSDDPVLGGQCLEDAERCYTADSFDPPTAVILSRNVLDGRMRLEESTCSGVSCQALWRNGELKIVIFTYRDKIEGRTNFFEVAVLREDDSS